MADAEWDPEFGLVYPPPGEHRCEKCIKNPCSDESSASGSCSETLGVEIAVRATDADDIRQRRKAGRVTDPWCSVWIGDTGQRGLRVSPNGEAWTWISKQQAEALLAELQAALGRLREREKRGIKDYG